MQDTEEEFDEQDEIEMCKNTVCSVETYRVNACVKAEKAYVDKYNVEKFKSLNHGLKQECYRFMVEKHARLEELIDMRRYQAGRERRRLRLKDAYLEQRHRKRLFEKMKSLADVPERNDSDLYMYGSVEYRNDTLGSIQSSQTVIRKTAKSTAKSTTTTVTTKPNESTARLTDNVIVVSKSIPISKIFDRASERYNYHESPEEIYEAGLSESESMSTYNVENVDGVVSSVDTSDDELCQSLETNRFNFVKIDTLSISSQSSRRSCRSSNQPAATTYSQFERHGLVTSTQEV